MTLVYVSTSPLLLKSSYHVLDQKYFDIRRCLHIKNLIEFSLDISVTKSLLFMILAGGQI